MNKESVQTCRITMKTTNQNTLSSSYGQLLTVTDVIVIGVSLLSKKYYTGKKNIKL